eukprot:g8908.t1
MDEPTKRLDDMYALMTKFSGQCPVCEANMLLGGIGRPSDRAACSWLDTALGATLIRLTMSVWTQMAASVKMGIMPLEQYKAMLAYGTKKLSKNANTGKGGQAKASKDKKIVPTPASPPPPSRPASSSQSYSTGAELTLAPPKGKTSKASRMGYAPTNPFGKTPTCNHPDFIRYGNGWGNFARCKACYQRWRWNDAEGVWKSDGFCSKPSHSPQSPWTAVESITQVYEEPLMLLGLRKRLSGNMAKNVKTLENEVNVLDHMPYKEIIKNKVDLLELYSGAARPTALAKQHGLTSLQPFEKDDGYDLNVRQVRKWCIQAINQFRPLLLLVGYPCTLYNIFNENLNYSSPDRRQELYELRQADLDGLRFAIQRCLQQLANGDLFFLENPLRSRLWDQPEVLRLAQHPDVIKGSCDSGAYGATDKDGYVIIKSFGYLTNSTEIAKELSCRMTKEEKTHARPLEGQRVTDSQVYPVKMVHALLRGLRAEAQRRDPARFQPVHWVLYAQPVHDEQRWTQALDMVKKLFGNTSARTITLKPSSEIYQIVSELVPWELSRVQATSRPMIRRLPQDFPYTHRGSAIQFNDNTFELESEDLGALEFPRQKFGRPVAFAIFFYGVAEDEDKKPDKPKEQEPHHHIPGLKTDVSFPGLPAGIPREVQASAYFRDRKDASRVVRYQCLVCATEHEFRMSKGAVGDA